jgi:hypothetical protein
MQDIGHLPGLPIRIEDGSMLSRKLSTSSRVQDAGFTRWIISYRSRTYVEARSRVGRMAYERFTQFKSTTWTDAELDGEL